MNRLATSSVPPAHLLWEKVLQHFRRELHPGSFKRWVQPARPLDFDGQTLTIAVPDAQTREWLASRLTNGLRHKLTGLLGYTVNVRFVIAPEATAQEQGPRSAQAACDAPETQAPSGDTASLHPLALWWEEDTASEASAPEVPSVRLHPHYTFETFIVGPSNEFAYSACRAVADRPGMAYNPLFLYGGVGLGKTHLLQAIAHTTLAAGLRVSYLTAEEFFNQFFQAIRNHRMEDFRRRFRNVDLLLVDDVHFLIGKERLQEEFFHTFNALYYEGRQIVFTADRPPSALAMLEERLRSRFEWGLIVDIQPPDYETRLAILRAKAEWFGLPLPDAVLELLARRLEGNIRTLEGALTRLRAYHELRGKPITPDVAEAMLADMLPRRLHIDPNHLLRIVAEEFGISVDKLLSPSRSRKVVLPRQVAMFLLREDARYSYPQIGQVFQGRDHTTVMYACEKIAREYERNEDLRKRIQRIRERLYAATGTTR